MEYDSASNCGGRLRGFEASEEHPRVREIQKSEHLSCITKSQPWHSLQAVAPKTNLNLRTVNRSLSSQVMEYYHKYSQNSKLDQYFSLPTTNTTSETIKSYYNIYEGYPKLEANRQDCVGEEYTLRSCAPRERRRWERPPLIGQPSNSEASPTYIQPVLNPESPMPDLKHVTTETIFEDRNESQETSTEIAERKISSPTSSVASHKPLEWDSGADVGYFNILPNSKQNDKKLSTIELMALARGCSAALRLDPEGTTESGISGKLAGANKNTNPVIPDANSTPLLENASGSESEIEITPIVKNHLPGIIAGNSLKCNETSPPLDTRGPDNIAQYSKKEQNHDTPKSSLASKVPFTKPTPEVRKVSPRQNICKENACPAGSPLKKSTSMNTLVRSISKLMLKRSQSELNLCGRDKGKATLPLLFNSSSSIATIVNKPSTCDKVIQTSLYACPQESVGVQVSVIEDEKPPLPKRGASLQKGSAMAPKNSRDTYKIRDSRRQESNETGDSLASEPSRGSKWRQSNSELSQNGSATQTTQPVDDAENISGRANSFEYFPGHVYENVPNGSGSHVSSSDTARSHSTLPNTSSSINEKLWGDSDSLVRDLERSVNILKSLVDANKCDNEVKKRLIHHVVKRLITAKYTDDKIEHNLEDNIPWNPDDTRSKVYEREILQALTKKQNASDSSGHWNPRKEILQGKSQRTGRSIMKGIGLESSSDKMDKNTDRTETDGRKARMGLRPDDCPRSSNATTDPDKSGSSDCFFPQRGRKGNKMQDIFCVKERRKHSQGDSTTTSTPPDHNRILLNAVVNGRRAAVRSSNSEEQADWRLLTTYSERQFELKKSGNSDSGDSKLVSYAEMEKRNQLIWITNEISHLCNLKKLLEESRRPERPRTSPRKSRSVKAKAMGSLANLQHDCKDDYSLRNGLRPRSNSMDDPWSSHCNLAACQLTSRSSSVVQRVRKRNSCAQTATNVTGAHSKTGGEIVSASTMHNVTVKLVSTGVQTVPRETSTIPALIQSEIVHYVACPAHSAMQFQTSHKCGEQGNPCLKHQAVQNVVTTCTQCLQEQEEQPSRVERTHGNAENLGERSPTGTRTLSDLVNGNSIGPADVNHHCVNKEVQTSPVGEKEAKNQINASKSLTCDCKGSHSCRCNNDTQCEKRAPFKECPPCTVQGTSAENGTSKCEECQKKMVQVSSVGDQNLKERRVCCECSTEQPNKWTPTRNNLKCYRSSNGYASSSNQEDRSKPCNCCNDFSCMNNREPEARKGHCSYHSRAQVENTRYYGHFVDARDRQSWPRCSSNGQANTESSQHKVQSKCDCDEESLHGRMCSAGLANHSEDAHQACDSDRNGKYCRCCGTAYQNVKQCSCPRSYPKAIAYELSFAKGKRHDNSFQKVPLSSGLIREGKIDGCVCSSIRRIGRSPPQESTLQAYLSKNKAEFLKNTAARRQRISEISQLQQLRKQKRIQLLAMASTSNYTKSPGVCKSTVFVQKKMSDEEMRLRLRKRYLRLNEVRQKRKQREKQKEARRNKFMANLFCNKLKQKVLSGQVDLSPSVSVISNM